MTARSGVFSAPVADAKRQVLVEALLAHHGNRTDTARALGMSRQWLLKLIHELSITIPSNVQGRRRKVSA